MLCKVSSLEFFALSVNDNSLPRNRVATCNPCFGKVLLCCRTRWRIPFSCSDVVLQMLWAITLACSWCNDALNCTLTTWFHLTRLETRTKESNICASSWQLLSVAKWKWLLGIVHQQSTDQLWKVWIWAYLLGPERWWTMPAKGQFRRNSDGGLQRYWRANRSSKVGIGAKD